MPVSPSVERSEVPFVTRAASRPRVVIADDDYDIRDILARMFVIDGFEVSLAKNGPRLVELVAEAYGAGTPPDVMIVDHLMPGRTGLEIIGAMTGFGWRCPVVLMTAFAGVTEAGRAAGVSVILKPFDPEQLRATVAAMLGRVAKVSRVATRWSTHDMDGPRCVACGRRTRLLADTHSHRQARCRACQEPADGWDFHGCD